jgi:Ca-activated chloride channel family protein
LASGAVEKQVVFGPTDAEIAEYERRQAQIRRRREAERAKQEVIDAARRRPKPTPSATSTFSIDVDTGSYTLTARKLARGQIPSADEIRVEEFINYFDYEYPPPDGAFGLTVEGAPSPFRREPDHYLVRFGVSARSLTEQERKPRHLTVVVDVSGSMRDANALPLVRASMRTLVDSLDPEDTVSLVSYATRVRLIASKVPVSERGKLRRALAMLEAGGGSALESGLAIALKHARENATPSKASRVVIFSDGAANIGNNVARRLSRQLRECDSGDVGLTVLGVGARVYNDALLEALADRCDGRYHHVNALPEAKRLFGPELDATLHTVAGDTKIQVIFESDTVRAFRRIGYDNRALPDAFFRRDDVDAGEVGAGESVTALYEIELEPGASGSLGELRVRYNEPNGAKGRELAAPFSTDDLEDSFAGASDDLRFSAALAGFAEILSRSALGYALNIDAIIAVAEDAANQDHDRKSAVYLMRRLIEVSR